MLNNSWNAIQTSLQNRLKPGIYQVWIKPLRAECTPDSIHLVAPNGFVASWVRDRLLGSIQEAAKEVLGKTPHISIQGQESQRRPTPERQAAPSPQKPPREASIGLPILPQAKSHTQHTWRFSFDDFVVGSSNEMAFMASHNFATQTFASDQLFLSSGPGLGKTHLIQAIGKAVAKTSNHDHVKTIYLTAEEFANQMVHALKSKTIDQFKALYRDRTDILLLEDINFLQGKEKMQDELLSTIKSLQAHGKKIVFTSSCLPKELAQINPDLSSRFCQGFISMIQKPDFETRTRIIRAKSQNGLLSIPRDVEELLAHKLNSDVRQLESCLQNLILKAKLLKENICTEMAMEVLENYDCDVSGMDLEQIVGFICKAYDISAQELASRSRKKLNVLARNTAFFLARKHTDLSLEKIGRQFNRRHSTVLKGINYIQREMSKKSRVGLQLERTVNALT
ncbi:chromosomal replication initiator protein DnaA [Desulfoplanes sp.]